MTHSSSVHDLAGSMITPEANNPCAYTPLLLPYRWLSVRENIERLRDPFDPRGAPVEVNIVYGKRYRAVRAEVSVPGYVERFPWIVIYAPLFEDPGMQRWLGMHEKLFIQLGATFHDSEHERAK